MPLRAVGVTAFLTVLFWGAWAWASSNGHATLGMIAGILLVPSAIALAGALALTFMGLARHAAERAVARRERARDGVDAGVGTPPAGAGDSSERFAA